MNNFFKRFIIIALIGYATIGFIASIIQKQYDIQGISFIILCYVLGIPWAIVQLGLFYYFKPRKIEISSEG